MLIVSISPEKVSLDLHLFNRNKTKIIKFDSTATCCRYTNLLYEPQTKDGMEYCIKRLKTKLKHNKKNS